MFKPRPKQRKRARKSNINSDDLNQEDEGNEKRILPKEKMKEIGNDDFVEEEDSGIEFDLVRQRQRQRQSMKRSKKNKKNDDVGQEDLKNEYERKDDSSQGNLKKNTKKKAKTKKREIRSSIMSFDLHENDDNDAYSIHDDDSGNEKGVKKKKNRKHKKKFKSRVGYGGSFTNANETSGSTTQPQNSIDEDSSSYLQQSSSMYGKAALEQLKKQQKKYVIRDAGNDEETLDHHQDGLESGKKQDPDDPDEKTKENQINPFGSSNDDYISLQPTSEGRDISVTPVLAGEDAFKQTIDEPIEDTSSASRLHLDTRMNTSLNTGNEDEWVDQIEKRGLSMKTPKNQSISNTTSKIFMSGKVSPRTSTSSLAKVKSTISSTADNLTESQNQLESSLRLQKVELANLTQSDSTLVENEREVQNHGKAFEFYQELRFNLVNYVGALREVSTKINLITTAMEDVFEEIGRKRKQAWKEEEDDIIHYLVKIHNNGKNDWLREIIGRKVNMNDSCEKMRNEKVDEFGRDLSHLLMLERNKRSIMRRKIRKDLSSISSNDDLFQIAKDESYDVMNDAFLGESQATELKKRYSSLVNAVEVATKDSDIDDEYLSIDSLCKVFEKWENLYPDEYNECYADLSFVDLVGVLVKAELYKCIDLLGIIREQTDSSLNKRSIYDFAWFQKLKKRRECIMNEKKLALKGEEAMKSKNQSDPDEKIIYSLFQKIVIPHFLHLVENAYDPFSQIQSKNVSSYFSSFKNILSGSKLENDMIHTIQTCMKKALDDRALPVLNNVGIIDVRIDQDLDVNEALLFTIRQTFKLKQLLLNICQYWVPAFQQQNNMDENFQRRQLKWFAEYVFVDIISSRILPSLATWRNEKNFVSSQYSKIVLKDIHQAIHELDWLEEKDFMLYSSPLRAATLSFDLEK